MKISLAGYNPDQHWTVSEIKKIMKKSVWTDFSDAEIKTALVGIFQQGKSKLFDKQQTEILVDSLSKKSNEKLYWELQDQRQASWLYESLSDNISRDILDEAFEKSKNSLFPVNHWSLMQILSYFFKNFIESFEGRQDRDHWIDEKELEEIKQQYTAFFPLAEKKMKHRGKTRSQKKAFLQELQNEFYKSIFSDFENIFSYDDEPYSEEEITYKTQTFIFSFLEDFEHNVKVVRDQLIYSKYFQLQQELEKKSLQKPQNTSQKTSNMRTKTLVQVEETSKDRNLEIETKITSVIDDFSLENGQKNELKRLLYRLFEKNKNLKKTDFFGENPLRFAIGAKDEGMFFDLLEELGIEIEESTEILEEQPSEEENQAFDFIEETHKQNAFENEGNALENTDTDSILASIEQRYTIANPEELRKDLENFKSKNGSQSVLKKMLNADLMQQVIAKGKGFFVIEIWGSERFVLEKNEGNLILKKFFDDHEKYDQYLSHLKY